MRFITSELLYHLDRVASSPSVTYGAVASPPSVRSQGSYRNTDAPFVADSSVAFFREALLFMETARKEVPRMVARPAEPASGARTAPAVNESELASKALSYVAGVVSAALGFARFTGEIPPPPSPPHPLTWCDGRRPGHHGRHCAAHSRRAARVPGGDSPAGSVAGRGGDGRGVGKVPGSPSSH